MLALEGPWPVFLQQPGHVCIVATFFMCPARVQEKVQIKERNTNDHFLRVHPGATTRSIQQENMSSLTSFHKADKEQTNCASCLVSHAFLMQNAEQDLCLLEHHEQQTSNKRQIFSFLFRILTCILTFFFPRLNVGRSMYEHECKPNSTQLQPLFRLKGQ